MTKAKPPAWFQRQCQECGAEFAALRRQARFCCDKCRNRNFVKKRNAAYRDSKKV